MTEGWVVELEAGCWLSGTLGDPGRTLRADRAKRYETAQGAKIALGLARKFRPFVNASIYSVGDSFK